MRPQNSKSSQAGKPVNINLNVNTSQNQDVHQPYPYPDSATDQLNPQIARRMLQAGSSVSVDKISQRQRQQAFRTLAGHYGNQAMQRLVKSGAKGIPTPTLAPTPVPALEVEPTPYDDVAKGQDFREPDVLAHYFSKLTSQHIINQLSYKKDKNQELVELSQEQQRRNQFNALGLGGWHLGTATEGEEAKTSTEPTSKKGKKKSDDQKSVEGKQYDQTGQWHFKENPQEVIEFFNKIVPVSVPGSGKEKLHMHEVAARRLEAVYAAAKRQSQAWPETTVGQSFRGNLEHHESTASLHAHKLGFAVDFRADVNPMLTDGRKRRLIAAVGGDAPNIYLKKGHRTAIRQMSHQYARLLKENHDKPLSEEQEAAFSKSNMVEQFFEGRNFEVEYERVRGVNNEFVGSLKAEVISELMGLRELYLTTRKSGNYASLLGELRSLESQLAKLEKAETKDEKAISEQTAAIASINARLDMQYPFLRERVQKLLKPWIEAVAGQKEVARLALEKEKESQATTTAQATKVAEAQAQFEQAKAQGKKTKLRLPPKQGKPKKGTKAENEAANELQKKTDELAYWKWLEDTLNVKSSTYLDFIFEKGNTKKVEVKPDTIQAEDEPEPYEAEDGDGEEVSIAHKSNGKSKSKKPSLPKVYKQIEVGVKDPSILQLATRGFFNPDKPQANGHDKGFNKSFVKLMLMHGFAWGATWGSQDTMHFELAEEIDKLPSSVRKYKQRDD